MDTLRYVWIVFDHGSVHGVYASEDDAYTAHEVLYVDAPDYVDDSELSSVYQVVRFDVDGEG
jgi:hypothetical protein